MTSTTEQYHVSASQVRSAMEKSVDFWKQSTRTLTDQTNWIPQLPQVDLGQAVDGYFAVVQHTLDASHDFASKWVEAANSLSRVAREQAESVGHIVREQAESVADLATVQATKAEQAVREQAEKVEHAAQAQEREDRKAKREQAKRAHDMARAPYQDLTKAQLSDILAERELPKTGSHEQLVERLVEADIK